MACCARRLSWRVRLPPGPVLLALCDVILLRSCVRHAPCFSLILETTAQSYFRGHSLAPPALAGAFEDGLDQTGEVALV